METEILEQLVWIKWLLVLALVGIVVPAALTTYVMVTAVRPLRASRKKKERFGGDLSDLMDKGLNEQVRLLTEERLKEYPADAYALFYHGKSTYLLGDYDRAVSSLRKAKELHPEWSKKYIDRTLKIAEERAKTQKGSDGIASDNDPKNGDNPAR